jgi:hypothetical protein
MFRIKAVNGNVIDIEDTEHAKRALSDGHEVFVFDPEDSKAKPKKWDGSDAVDEPADADSE